MVYALVRNGFVVNVERRSEELVDLYPRAILHEFLPVPEELQDSIRRGWIYTETGFQEPDPFTVHEESGMMTLPDKIYATDIYALQDEVSRLTERLTILEGKLSGN